MPRPADLPFDRSGAAAARATRLALVGLALLAIGLPQLGVAPAMGLLTYHQVGQDLLLLPLFLAATFLLTARPSDGRLPAFLRGDLAAPVLAVGLVLLCLAGRQLLTGGYALSRDEQMAGFDAAIFAAGRLYWPFPQDWRPFAAALNQSFILPIGDRQDWVSAYLPVNALLQMVLGPFSGPLLIGVGVLALWRVTLRLWPERPGPRAVALLLFAGSGQLLFNGMTAFATSGHLALNLLWLALFLRRDRAGAAGAVIVGFAATGLHQPLFHPLFVAPFLLLLVRERRWRTLAGYVVAYAAICLFWLAWPMLIGAGAAAPQGEQAVSYLDRLLAIIRPPGLDTLWLMAANLLRFATWQHLLLLPLAGLGAAAWRRDPMVAALLAGPVLLLLVMGLLLPWQGHGWGYRYLHGYIGSACLLGGHGWQRLELRGGAPARAMVAATLATILLTWPLQAWIVAGNTRPSRDLDRRIAAIDADMAIVDDGTTPYARDLVINRPDLSNRPVRLIAGSLRPADMPRLCARGSIAFVDPPLLAPLATLYGVPVAPAATAEQRALKLAARAAGCRVVTPQVD